MGIVLVDIADFPVAIHVGDVGENPARRDVTMAARIEDPDGPAAAEEILFQSSEYISMIPVDVAGVGCIVSVVGSPEISNRLNRGMLRYSPHGRRAGCFKLEERYEEETWMHYLLDQ